MTHPNNAPVKPEIVGMARVKKEHANSCWNVLVKHCATGNCTCHIGPDLSLNILEGCLDGRVIYDDYKIALERFKATLI